MAEQGVLIDIDTFSSDNNKRIFRDGNPQSDQEPWQNRALKAFTAVKENSDNELLNARRYFQDNFDANYISAMRKVFGMAINVVEPDLTPEEKAALVGSYPELLEYGIKSVPSTLEEEYYQLFLKYVDSASRYFTKLAETGKGEYHEYKIVGIENVRHLIVKEHGEYVYSRASAEVPYLVEKDGISVKRDFAKASKRLCCLVDRVSPMSPIIDLDLYRQYLGYKGIETSVDYESNTFKFGTKKEETLEGAEENPQTLAYSSK